MGWHLNYQPSIISCIYYYVKDFLLFLRDYDNWVGQGHVSIWAGGNKIIGWQLHGVSQIVSKVSVQLLRPGITLLTKMHKMHSKWRNNVGLSLTLPWISDANDLIVLSVHPTKWDYGIRTCLTNRSTMTICCKNLSDFLIISFTNWPSFSVAVTFIWNFCRDIFRLS